MISDKLRVEPTYPIYPPYHTGLYLEEYFFDFYKRNSERFQKIKREYIPIFWTNCYVNGVVDGWGDTVDINDIQGEINTLNSSGSYFTICQHDDAPMNPLPKNTVIFSAGGNVIGPGVVPIPLVCGPIDLQFSTEKTLLASFVGSNTHEVRNKMIHSLQSKEDVYISSSVWNPEVNDDNLSNFVTQSLKSKFVLCPRGYGASSFRLYEAMQLGAVPVYVSDRFWIPWVDELDWNEFCVLIPEQGIDTIHSTLSSIDDATYNKMKNNISKLYDAYFSLEGVCENILKRLEMEPT